MTIAHDRIQPLARRGGRCAIAEFLYTRLRDTDSGLILDGVHEPGGRLNRTVHTYSQGVVIGLETELAVRTGESGHHRRVAALVAAARDGLTDVG